MKKIKLFTLLLFLVNSITAQQIKKEVLIESSLYYLTDQHGLKKDNTEVYTNTTIYIDYKYKQLTFKEGSNGIVVYKISSVLKLNKDIIKIVLFDSVNNSSIECHYSGKHRFILFLNLSSGEKNKLYLIN